MLINRTGRDMELAHSISSAVARLDAVTAGVTSAELGRPVQMLEMAIDALDIPAIRPFLRAVMAYADEPGSHGPEDAIVDPAGQLPPRHGCGRRSTPAACWWTTRMPGRSGYLPTSRATRCASALGPTATSATPTTDRHER